MKIKPSLRVLNVTSRVREERAHWETFPTTCRRGTEQLHYPMENAKGFCLAFLAQSWSLASALPAMCWHPIQAGAALIDRDIQPLAVRGSICQTSADEAVWGKRLLGAQPKPKRHIQPF